MNIERFKGLVPDEQMRQFILSDTDDGDLGSTRDYCMAFNAVLNLAFIYAYSCCKDLHNRLYDPRSGKTAYDKCLENSNANSHRVLKTVERIYTDFQIGPQLIQYVLSDIYFDFSVGDDSKLCKVLPDCISARPGDDFILSEYFNYVNRSFADSRYKGFKIQEASEKLERLIRVFPFLENTSLCYAVDRDWYVFKRKPDKIFTDGKINTFGVIRRFEEYEPRFYFLRSLETNALRYESLNQTSFIIMPVCEYNHAWRFGEVCAPPFEIHQDFESIETFLKKTSNSAKSIGQNVALKQIFNINYKSIKNLALAISDVIGRGEFKNSKQSLEKAFRNDYEMIFKNAEDDWDSIIVMLLIEAGPLRILQNVFLSNSNIDRYLIRNIKLRFPQSFSERLSAISDEDDLSDEAESLLGDGERREHYIHTAAYGRRLAEAKARIILEALSSESDKKIVAYDYNNNLKQTIGALAGIEEGNARDEDVDFLNSSLQETLKRTICFYAGIFGYGKIKYDKYDNASPEELFPADSVRKCKDAAISNFIDAAKTERKKLEALVKQSRFPIRELFKELVTMCERCVDISDNGVYSRTEDSKYLNAAIGKYFIFNLADFKECFDLQYIPDVDKSNLGVWLTKSIQLIKFLRTGDANAECNDEDFRKSIYPLVGTYCRSNESEDGYHTSVFSLEIDKNLNGVIDYVREIKVLSEFDFDYNLGCKYYCLPNVSRYTQKWWIDPLIIECSVFDKIFKDGEE